MTPGPDHVVQVRKVTKYGDLGGTALTYRYGSPLRVGDRVMCPGNEWGGPFIAEVSELGPGAYTGSLRSLLCRVAPDRKRK
jgi:hypothetical protein